MKNICTTLALLTLEQQPTDDHVSSNVNQSGFSYTKYRYLSCPPVISHPKTLLTLMK